MAVLRYHWRCTRNSLPGSSSRFTTKSCNTFSQATSSRDPARRVSQNSCKPSCRHNSHPNQQLPNSRGRRSSRPLTFTCRLSTASAGVSRSSGKQTQVRILLLLFIKYRKRLAPCCLLLVVDLTQIENRSLHRSVGSQTMVFNDAEVAMILAVFVAVDAAQKHDKRRVPDLRPQGKVLGLHSPVFQMP